MTTDTRQQSNEERLIELVTTYRAGLLAYTRHLVGADTTRAEDVVQETFARAWDRIDRLTADQGSVIGWLRRVAYNIAIDGHRMRQVRPAEVELTDTDIASLDDHSEHVVLSMTVEQLLENVWPEYRVVLVELYLNDRSTAEAAAVLGIPVGTVKSRSFNALRRLRKTLPHDALLAS